jgi:hypothetical protein
MLVLARYVVAARRYVSRYQSVSLTSFKGPSGFLVIRSTRIACKTALLTRVLVLSTEAGLGQSGQGVRRAPFSAQAATSPALGSAAAALPRLFCLAVVSGFGFVFARRLGARRSGCFCQALALGCLVGRSGGSNGKRVFLLARVDVGWAPGHLLACSL